jgi:UDPglucose 6-dehydrogenase
MVREPVASSSVPGGPIAVVGAGHVGLVSATCLAAVGNRVRLFDVDADRIDGLRAGRMPFVEPSLDALFRHVLRSGAISVHATPGDALAGARAVFICVNTPNRADGSVELDAVKAATETAVAHAPSDAVLVNRSTAPVGTAEYLRSIAEEAGSGLRIAVNPEFLAEGTAVRDFLRPDRIVVGAWDVDAADAVLRVYRPIVHGDLPHWLPGAGSAGRHLLDRGVPVVRTDPPTAELVKYAANGFLAVKISFINEIASIADDLGADVVRVAEAIGLDRRIGPHFLRAGLGWGGSCFPKDIVALRGMAETRGLEARMLSAAHDVNLDQQRWVVRKLQQHLRTLVGRRIGLLGIAFKPDTDDIRSAPSLQIADDLARLGARVRGFDPAIERLDHPAIELVRSPLELAADADALVLVTDWRSFRDLDLEALARVVRVPLLLDGRNLFDPAAVERAGFMYVGIGRSMIEDAQRRPPRRATPADHGTAGSAPLPETAPA